MKIKGLSMLLAIVVTLVFALPAYADQNAGQSRDIRIKAGSTQMKVNGQAVKISAPYAAGGTTMIPMAVFTKGIGAKLTLKNNKVITLTYSGHTAILTIGSKTATLDGKKTNLAAAPAVKSGVTYAPIKVAEALGAKVKTDPSSKEISIVISAPAPATTPDHSGGTAIDADAGKTKIGDSYYQWSMNYPTGLVQDNQSENGDQLVFRDVKKEYYLGIFVETAKETLSVDDQRARLTGYLDNGETITDKQSLTGPGGSTYEQLTTKDKNGFYFQFRGLQANGNFYVVIFGKKASAKAELQQAAGVVESFRTSFDLNDAAIKDLTKIKGDLKMLKYDDYGLSITLPKAWTADTSRDYPYYQTDDAYLLFKVSSPVNGETVDAWLERQLASYPKTFAPQYRKDPEISDVTWNGVPAKMAKFTYSMDTVTWMQEYEIFAVQGNHRYYTEFAYPLNKQDTYGSFIQTALPTLKVDIKKVDDNYGNIPDEYDVLNEMLTSVKTSEKYKYSLTIPQYWISPNTDLEKPVSAYFFLGGGVAVSVFEDVSDPQTVIAQIRNEYATMASQNAKYKIIENTTATFAGKSALKLVVEDTRNIDVTPQHETAYIFEHKGSIYMVNGYYKLANATDFVMKQAEAAVNSFKLND